MTELTMKEGKWKELTIYTTRKREENKRKEDRIKEGRRLEGGGNLTRKRKKTQENGT